MTAAWASAFAQAAKSYLCLGDVFEEELNREDNPGGDGIEKEGLEGIKKLPVLHI